MAAMRDRRHFILCFSGDPLGARRGQTVIETAVLVTIIIFAFIAMQVYLKRGIQGRLRGTIDGIGEQYDPDQTTSDYNLVHESDVTTTSESSEEMYVDPMSYSGQYQNRLITMVHVETHYDNSFKNGFEYVGAP
ncbi:hypothetical protein BU251_00120 [Candidatus Velamenicoccus archaeovorus]|uniref:Uncharacterized protein n=2 Tax=Velamenicoccus archaeovorus TaxID=1930593 RepID=A0A410P2K7_VELA1|nr:hypothetical protein BU251_00120 [Candidatus Velamenicoccus archaeovorus]